MNAAAALRPFYVILNWYLDSAVDLLLLTHTTLLVLYLGATIKRSVCLYCVIWTLYLWRAHSFLLLLLSGNVALHPPIIWIHRLAVLVCHVLSIILNPLSALLQYTAAELLQHWFHWFSTSARTLLILLSEIHPPWFPTKLPHRRLLCYKLHLVHNSPSTEKLR